MGEWVSGRVHVCVEDAERAFMLVVGEFILFLLRMLLVKSWAFLMKDMFFSVLV